MSALPERVKNESGEVALSWKNVLAEEKQQPYFRELLDFVERERAAGKRVYPSNSDVFRAFALTPFDQVQVIILGQDPYHGFGQAHGLCFSVLPPTPPPPSLLNIFLELKADVGVERPVDGSLERWAHQGVLLLNSVLTVEDGRPGSHANKGWERFTDKVIRELNERCSDLVFLLWGAYAQRKAAFVDTKKHRVLSAPHPSPLSAHRGFLGCKHFSKTNEFLTRCGRVPIEW